MKLVEQAFPEDRTQLSISTENWLRIILLNYTLLTKGVPWSFPESCKCEHSPPSKATDHLFIEIDTSKDVNLAFSPVWKRQNSDPHTKRPLGKSVSTNKMDFTVKRAHTVCSLHREVSSEHARASRLFFNGKTWCSYINVFNLAQNIMRHGHGDCRTIKMFMFTLMCFHGNSNPYKHCLALLPTVLDSQDCQCIILGYEELL